MGARVGVALETEKGAGKGSRSLKGSWGWRRPWEEESAETSRKGLRTHLIVVTRTAVKAMSVIIAVKTIAPAIIIATVHRMFLCASAGLRPLPIFYRRQILYIFSIFYLIAAVSRK